MLAVLLLVCGCQPEIGDSCNVHSDCSRTGGRICDPTQPGGYCTQFNCDPGKCPEEAVCVAFSLAPTSQLECAASPSTDRLFRKFCMRSCDSDGDCRTGSGYRCVDLGSGDNSLGAVVVENGSHSNKICTQPLPQAAVDESGQPVHSTEVCNPPPNPVFPKPDAGAPDASADGASPEAGKPDAGPDGAAGSDAARPDAAADGAADARSGP